MAAGASRRMGSVKALLQFEGETFVDRLVGVFERHCGEVIVVLGHHAEAIRQGMKRQARFAVNPDPERGMLSSLQSGCALLSADTDVFLFMPVDYPAVESGTVAKLLAALANDTKAQIAVPRYGDRRGHPVACRGALAAEFLNLPAEAQAREVVHRHVAETVYVDVDDAGILMDVDDPAAYERLLAGHA